MTQTELIVSVPPHIRRRVDHNRHHVDGGGLSAAAAWSIVSIRISGPDHYPDQRCILCRGQGNSRLERPVQVRDGSAVITGLLLAYVIPAGSLLVADPRRRHHIRDQGHIMGGLGFNIHIRA